MKTSVAAIGAVGAIVAVSVLALPTVANGAEYLASHAADATAPARASLALTTGGGDASGAANPSGELNGLITVWATGGAVLLGAGAVTVAASVRRQRKLAT